MEDIVLMFSRGKDAIGAWFELSGKYNIIPVYYYIIPDLIFVEKSIKYYENFFNTKIYQIPSERYIDAISHYYWQEPKNIERIDNNNFFTYDKYQLDEYLKKRFNVNKIAIGIKRYDSLQRMKMKNFRNDTLYPVFEKKDNDICDMLTGSGVKLPIDYKVWGCTFDGYTYKWLYPMKMCMPEEYEKVKTYFPLIDVEFLRYEKNKEKFPNYEIKRRSRVKKYLRFVME